MYNNVDVNLVSILFAQVEISVAVMNFYMASLDNICVYWVVPGDIVSLVSIFEEAMTPFLTMQLVYIVIGFQILSFFLKVN